MRRSLTFLFTGLFVLALLAAASFVPNSPASAEPLPGVPTTYCGDPSTDGSIETSQAGGMITCDTTITNTITAIDVVTGVASGSSVIRVVECIGPANGRLDPADLTCTEDEQILVGLVTTVNQCNGVGYGGGAVLECFVDVTNEFVGVTPQVISDATVNQCNGSATDTTGCNPFPASTTNATITQCNNSSYGGGQEDFNCDASGTTTASFSVTVTQCNDSNYGGGSWLNCGASLTNIVIAAPPTASPTAAPTEAPTAAPTEAPTAPPGVVVPTAPPAATPTAPPGAVVPTAPPAATPTAPPGAVVPTAPPTAPAGVIPTAAPTAPTGVVPGASPTVPLLPDTSIADQSKPQQGGFGFVLLAGLFVLTLPLWKIFIDRRARNIA